MSRFWLVVLLSFSLAFAWMALIPAGAALARQGQPFSLLAPTPPAYILSPQADAALQGKVAVTGYTAVDGLQAWLLEFGHASDTTGTWFFISEGDQPISDGTLTEWDTTTLTDGDYILRLTARRAEADPIAHAIPVRIRNYTPIETATPEPTAIPTATSPGDAPAETAAATIIPPTLTPLPTNPAELTLPDVAGGMKLGALLVIGVFALVAAYVWARRR